MSQTVEQQSEHSMQKQELAVQKKILQVEEKLVQWVEKALKEGKYYNKGEKKLEESQFRNLLRVAQTTESPEVIKNFLRYQVGRDEKWGRGEGSLAEKIIDDIDCSIQEQAASIQTQTSHKSLNEIWIRLIRLYLGYGQRRLVYLNSLAK
ncbi:MAG: hypothetical protein ACFB4I_23275 [Cyanophyceae cyanobacterium]